MMEEYFLKVNPYDLTQYLKTFLGIEAKKPATHICKANWLLTCDEWSIQLTDRYIVLSLTHSPPVPSAEWLYLLKSVNRTYLFKLIEKLYYQHILALKREGEVWAVSGYCPSNSDRYYIHDEIGYAIRRKDGFVKLVSDTSEYTEDISATTIYLPVIVLTK
jgi:hypothetical protein